MMLLTLAAAVAPVVQALPPPPEITTLDKALIAALGLWMLRDFIAPLLRGSFARNVATEDEAKKKLTAQADATTEKLNRVERELDGVKQAQTNYRESLTTQLGAIDGQLTALDRRIEGQGRSQEAKMEKAINDLSIDLNRKISMSLAADIPELVRKVVREELNAMRPTRRGEPPSD